MKTNRKSKVGVVLSHKMNKTMIVAVERLALDPTYKKYRKKVKRFKVHDEKNECRMGDRVKIVETAPVSKEKRWRLVTVVSRAAAVEAA